MEDKLRVSSSSRGIYDILGRMGKSKGGGGNRNQKPAEPKPKRVKVQKKTGKTIGGYTPEKLAIRAAKRQGVVSSKPE